MIHDEFLTVKDNDGWNVISLKDKGKKMCKRSFEQYCTYLGEVDGQHYFSGSNKKGCNVYTADGEPICPTMHFDSISSIYNNKWVYVISSQKENILTLNGELLSDDTWYDKIQRVFFISETNPLIKISDDGKESFFNIITRKPINKWFDKVETFPYNDNQTRIYDKGKINLLNNNGEIVFPEWVDDLKKGTYDFYIVTKDGKQNVWYNDSYLLDEWALEITCDYRNMYITYENNDSYKLDVFNMIYGR
jgi:hypothetical protein